MNNIGVIQLRRPVTPQTGRATYYFNQALKLDQDDPDYYFNLGYAYWAEKDAQSAIFWLREAVRRDPADGEAHAVLAAALAGDRRGGRGGARARARDAVVVDLRRVGEEAGRSGSRVDSAGARAAQAVAGSVHPAPRRQRDRDGRQREQKELATFHLDRGRRLFEQGNNSEAVTELSARDLSLAVRGGSAPAAGAHLPENRADGGGHRRLQDRAVEPGIGRGTHRAGAGLPSDERLCERSSRAGARPGARSEFFRSQGVTR